MAIAMIEPATDAQTNVLERVIIEGDLSVLTPAERVNYYNEVCRTLGLNPFTKPFDYLRLQDRKLTLYALKNATDQLRKLHGISISQLDVKDAGDYYSVIAYGKDKEGRLDSALASVWVKNSSGEARCNLMMKCETKAKRRLTLSMCGLGFLDETEVETVPGARTRVVDTDTGEVLEQIQTKRIPTLDDHPDIIRSADDADWQKWMRVLAKGQGLGLNPEQLRLPIARDTLRAHGNQVLMDIKEREAMVAG